MDVDQIGPWTAWMEARGLLPNTIRLYRRTLERVAREAGPPGTLGFARLEEWLMSAGGSPSTLSNRISALRSFYRWMVRTERRDDDPTLKLEPPRRRKGLPKPVRDLEAALRYLDDYDARVGLPEGQSRAIATFMAETGLRMSEAIAVNEPVPVGDEITVIGKGAKEAFVLLTPKAREALDHLGGRIPIGARAVQRRFERAGFHPHQLRHWRASSLIERGVDIGDVSKILRHSSPATTMIYAEFAKKRLRAALGRGEGAT